MVKEVYPQKDFSDLSPPSSQNVSTTSSCMLQIDQSWASVSKYAYSFCPKKRLGARDSNSNFDRCTSAGSV